MKERRWLLTATRLCLKRWLKAKLLGLVPT